MKKITIYIVAAVLCLNFTAIAQSLNDKAKPLNIGDTIPEAVWDMPLQVVNHPQGKKTITLNDYRGKLIILDFWATWCGSCISSMVHMSPLHKLFKDSLTIIPCTSELPEKAATFLKTNPALKPLNLFSVVNDGLMNKIFPHQSIPHYIWISMDGRYISQASAEFILAKNIRKILSGGKPDWQEKVDIDTRRPLFISNSLPPDAKIGYYSILVEGRVTGLITGFGSSYTGKQRDLFYSNYSIKQIYESIATKMMRAIGIKGSIGKRLIFNVESGDPVFNKKLFTYQYIGPIEKSDSLYADALKNLNNVSGYYGRIEKKKLEHLNLVSTNGVDRLKTTGGKSSNKLNGKDLKITNCPISILINRLNEFIAEAPLIIDATGYEHNIDINLDFTSSNIDTIKVQLQAIGLNLDLTNESTEVFILSKSISNKSNHD